MESNNSNSQLPNVPDFDYDKDRPNDERNDMEETPSHNLEVQSEYPVEMPNKEKTKKDGQSPEVWGEIHELEDEFKRYDKSPETQRSILFDMNKIIAEKIRELEEKKLSKVVHRLSADEIKNMNQDILSDKELLSDYLYYGTNNEEGIKEFIDKKWGHFVLMIDKYGDESDLSGNTPTIHNIDVFFENKPDYLNSENISEKLTPDFIVRNLESLSKNGIDVGQAVANLDSGFLENLDRRKINQLKDLGVDNELINKIELPKRERRERESIEAAQKIKQRLEREPDSVSAVEILANYEHLKDLGFSMSIDELAEKLKREKESYQP